MMRFLFYIPLLLALAACQTKTKKASPVVDEKKPPVVTGIDAANEPGDPVVIETEHGAIGFYPEAESDALASKYLPLKGSEDATSVLGLIKPPPSLAPLDFDEAPAPHHLSQWVFGARLLPEGSSVSGEQVMKAFPREWQKKYGYPMIYGRDFKTGRSSFVGCADCPTAFDMFEFAWEYAPKYEPTLPTLEVYQERIESVTAALSSLGKFDTMPSRPIEEAVEYGQAVTSLRREYSMDLLIILKAPEGGRFDGKKAWDVLLSLGLDWGDGDLFHWKNNSGIGNQYHFSVWTSTEPGYFLPRPISEGEFHPEDLIFGFQVGRCADPATVYARMVGAAEYAQKRLGGTVVAPSGKPLPDAAVMDEYLKHVAAELERMKIPPGSADAMRLF